MIELIEKYGYVAVFVGAFLEGETLLVIAGFLAASGGYLDLGAIIACGFAGGLAGDQTYFYLGRARGRQFLDHRESWRPRVAWLEALFTRHATLLMLGYRFMYGVRLVTPMFLGAFRVGRLRFLAFNVVNASAWATIVVGLGYLFGEVVTDVFDQIRRYELLLVALLAVIGIAIWLLLRIRGR
jgi:membrane protein DedA with SNARE-associated domain